MSSLVAIYKRIETATREFECCDTTFSVSVDGVNATAGADAAVRTARRLESRLNAFDTNSVVTELYREGNVTDADVAVIVNRGLEYLDRTDGAFDVRYGEVEHTLKAYIRDEETDAESWSEPAEVTVEGNTVRTDRPLDLNGLAKGYLVDQSAAAANGLGRQGFVNGGGDIGHPTGPVAIESPYGGKPLQVLDTDWNVATSGGYKRERGTVDHIYDPQTKRARSRNILATVVAKRDCMEADALATTCSALPADEALELIRNWPGAEAFLCADGVFKSTGGFHAHLA